MSVRQDVASKRGWRGLTIGAWALLSVASGIAAVVITAVLAGVAEVVELFVDGPPRNYPQILAWPSWSIVVVGIAALIVTASLAVLALIQRSGPVLAAIALVLVGLVTVLALGAIGVW